MPFEKNELNEKAMGGTELMQLGLSQHVGKPLLDEFQIIASRVRKLDSEKQKVLWLHDLHGDPEAQHLKDGGWKEYDKLVFVSHWQQQMYNAYLGVPLSAGTVLKNAIVPIEPHVKPDDGKIRLIYTSTPHRGLDILYAAFDALSQQYDNIELDVYSSFSLYGWPERDKPYIELFDKLRQHPKINYHKSQPNSVVRDALKQAHIFAYPSTWQETSCLALIEAMSAGCLCVHSSLAALPETSMNLTQMYDYTEDTHAHANLFYAHLKYAIDSYNDKNRRVLMSQNLTVMSQLTESVYGWHGRGLQWTNMLKQLLTKRNQ